MSGPFPSRFWCFRGPLRLALFLWDEVALAKGKGSIMLFSLRFEEDTKEIRQGLTRHSGKSRPGENQRDPCRSQRRSGPAPADSGIGEIRRCERQEADNAENQRHCPTGANRGKKY